jgi:chromosomal replication initiation ATPase DnaA
MDNDSILNRVAQHFGISIADMCGPSQRQHIAKARHAAMFLLVDCGMTQQAVAAQLNRRDHTTVIAAVRHVRACGDAYLKTLRGLVQRTANPAPVVRRVSGWGL